MSKTKKTQKKTDSKICEVSDSHPEEVCETVARDGKIEVGSHSHQHRPVLSTSSTESNPISHNHDAAVDREDEDEEEVSPSSRNYVADLVQKSYTTAANVAIKASEEIKQRIANRSSNVNEQFITKACQLWSKLHSTPAPVPFSEFQTQLMGVYQEVLAGSSEIKRTLQDSQGETLRVRVRRVSEAAVLVSTRGLAALVDFAEQKIDVILPPTSSAHEQQQAATTYDDCDNMILADRLVRSPTASKIITSFDKSFKGLPKRVVSLPLIVSFRILRSVNIRGSQAILFLQSSTKNHLDKLTIAAANRSQAIKQELARIPQLTHNLREHASEHVQLSVVKDYAAFYSKRMVQLRRDIYEAVEKQAERVTNSDKLAQIKAQLALWKPYVMDAAPVEQVKIMQEKLMSDMVMPLYQRVLAGLHKQYQRGATLSREFIVSFKKNAFSVTQTTAQNTLEKLKHHRDVLLANARNVRDNVLAVKDNVVEMVKNAKTDMLKTAKSEFQEKKESVFATGINLFEAYVPLSVQSLMKSTASSLSSSA